MTETMYEEPPPMQSTSMLNRWHKYMKNDFIKDFGTLSIQDDNEGSKTLQEDSSASRTPIEDHLRD